MIKALIFDFDGTILDTETAEFRRWQELYATHGLELSLSEWQQGIGTWGSYDPWAGLPESVRGRRSEVNSRLREQILADIREMDVRPGERAVIGEAHGRGLALAIATSSDRAWVEEWLARHDLARFFPVLSTQDDVARVKPDPEVYLKALTGLGVQAHEALAIEDSLNGATAAMAAGMPVVVVPNDVTASQPFPAELLRLEGFGEGLEGLLAAVTRR